MSDNAHNHAEQRAVNVAAKYIDIWNENDEARRLDLIRSLFSSDLTYIDPIARSTGHDAFNALIGAVQQQFAGLRFRLHGKQDAHHDVVRFSWALGAEDGEALVIGTDIAEIAHDGRVRNVTGFIDKMPAAAH